MTEQIWWPTVLADDGRVTNVIYQDFCKVLNTVLHNTLVSKLETQFDRSDNA